MGDSPKPSLLSEFRAIANPKSLSVFGSSLLVPLAAFMLYPFLIIYFTHILKLSVAEAGLLLSIRFLSSGFLGFLGGMVSERIGLSRTYLLAGLVTGATLFIMGFEHAVPVLAGLLVLLGVSASTVNAMARGLVNDSVDEKGRGIAQNYVHWLNNIGMAAALPISALALGGGYSRIPFDVSAAAYAVMAVSLFVAFGAFGTPRPQPAHRSESGRSSSAPWSVLATDRAFLWLMVAFLLVVAVEMQFESGVPLDLSFHFHQGARLYGVLGVIDMAVVIVLQMLVSHWLGRRKSPWFGYLGMVAVGGLIIGGVWQTPLAWTISIVLLGVGDVFAYGQIFNLMGVIPTPGRQGTYFSILGMVQGLATFVAYAFGADLYQNLHAGWMFGLTVPVALLAVLSYRNAQHWHQRQAALAQEKVG